MKKYDYLIVGGGLFGATFARIMADAGKKCLVLERRGHIGGNVYTENIEGIPVHKYGAHIFHTSDKEAWDFVNRFANFNSFINSPIANYNGEIYNLPFNMNTFAKLFDGVVTPEDARRKIEEEKKEGYTENPTNLEEQAIKLVGKTVYEKLIKGYTEKQWGKPCRELPSFIIKRIPVRFTYDNNYFNDVYQGIPENGYTELVENMLSGIEVRLGVDYLAKRDEYRQLADKVLYTGAIDEYFEYCLGELEYRSLAFENVIDVGDRQGVAVVNYTSSSVPYTRIIEHKHFSKGKSFEKTVLTYEYPKKWVKGDEAYYPVNDEKNASLYAEYENLAKKEDGVIFGGRLGQYRYYDMDDTVIAALTLTKGLL